MEKAPGRRNHCYHHCSYARNTRASPDLMAFPALSFIDFGRRRRRPRKSGRTCEGAVGPLPSEVRLSVNAVAAGMSSLDARVVGKPVRTRSINFHARCH